MKDDENPSDYIAPPESKRSTMPAAAKVSREILHGIRDIVLPAMCLVSMKLGFEQGGWLFGVSVVFILGGNMGIRKGEGAIDVADLINILKR